MVIAPSKQVIPTSQLFSDPLITGLESNPVSVFSIYPQPADQFIIVDVQVGSRYEILDFTGKVISTGG
jgi:hypothetical protein